MNHYNNSFSNLLCQNKLVSSPNNMFNSRNSSGEEITCTMILQKV